MADHSRALELMKKRTFPQYVIETTDQGLKLYLGEGKAIFIFFFKGHSHWEIFIVYGKLLTWAPRPRPGPKCSGANCVPV